MTHKINTVETRTHFLIKGFHGQAKEEKEKESCLGDQRDYERKIAAEAIIEMEIISDLLVV